MTTTPALRRFLRYVSFDTQSSTQTGTHPSTPGQLALAGVPGGEAEWMDGEAFERARKEHVHPLWRTTGALAAKDGGHGGWKTAAPAAIGDVDLAAPGLA